MNEKYTLVKPYQIEMVRTQHWKHQNNLYEILQGPSELNTELKKRENNKVVTRIRNYPELIEKRQQQTENKFMLKKLIDISCGTIQSNFQKKFAKGSSQQMYKRSQHEGITKREKKRILHDNNAMALRITSQSATINRDKQLKDSQKYLDLMKRLEKIPRAQRIARTAITNPEYRYTFYGNKQKTARNSDMNSTAKHESSKREDTYENNDTSRTNFLKTQNKTTNNWFGQTVSSFEKPRFDKNPHEYTLEMILNKMTTFKTDCDKYRFIITHNSFDMPIVFNPAFNDVCCKTVLSSNKCKNDIEQCFQIFAVKDHEEEFVFEFAEKFKVGKTPKHFERVEETANGKCSLTMQIKIH